jgi:simple sugar transport system permease protein
MVCGGIWGAVPGIFKAYFNVNEVITSIMFNWIGLYLVNELMYRTVKGMYDQKTTRTYKLSSAAPGSIIPDLGLNSVFKTSSTTIAIFIAILIAVLMYIILNKTTFGYELKACGFNKDAAKYAGINEKRNIVLSMTISGALAGIGAGLYYLSGAAEWNPQVATALPAIGFNGIPVALLALSNPIGVVFAAFFVAHISVGGAYLPTKYFQPEIADLIVAVIIYLCAFVMLFKNVVINLIQKKAKKKEGKEEAN